jgi:hypothetical protein
MRLKFSCCLEQRFPTDTRITNCQQIFYKIDVIKKNLYGENVKRELKKRNVKKAICAFMDEYPQTLQAPYQEDDDNSRSD